MSVLTRIKNNQITDSTILANTKIVPGSIVGSLFNANLTMTSDVTITGNLTVQGSSTYLTVASTNTYVNDPLIVMNNAFVGTNTNDIGLLFNRGSDTNQAFIWDESEDEFRLIATSETGDTYGAVTTSSYANVRVGNINVQGAAAFGSLSTTGNIGAVNLTLSGDAAVNGGDLTTTAATFNLLTSDATTVNAFTAATTLELGAASGTTNINNNLEVDGNIAVDGENLTVTATTFNLVNTTATTVNAFGAATTLSIGAGTGNLTLNNATITTPGQIVSTRAGSATTGNGQIFLNGTTSNRIDWSAAGTGAPAFTTRTDGTKVVLYPALSGSTVDYAIGIDSATMWSSVPENTSSFNFKWYGAETLVANLSGTGNFTTVGDIAVNGGDLTTTAGTFNLLNTDATTVNFAGAATTLIVGATSGVANIRNETTNIIGNTNVGGALDVTGAATLTTANVQGDTNLGLTTAAAINNTPIGNATPSTGSFTTLISSGVTQVTDTTVATSVGTGAFRVDGGASVSGNLWVGGNINIVGSSYVISGNAGQFYGDVNGFGALYAGVTGFTSLPQTVFQVAADINNYAQVNFENVNTGADASTDYVATAGNGSDFNHYINMGITSPNWDGTQDNSLTTALSGNDGYLYAQGDATNGGNLVIGASTPGRTVSVIVGGNTASNVTAVYRAPGTVSTTTSTGALTVDGGVGVSGNLTAGNLTVVGTTTFTSNVGVSSDAQSTTSANGALVVSGGVGIAKNLNVGGDVVITGNLTVDGTTTTLNTATLDVEDLNITVAKGAASAAAANGAGLTVDGAGATLLYADADDSWNVNKLFKGNAASFSSTLGVTGDTTLTGDLAVNGGDLTTTATTFNLLDATAETVNAFGAATAIDLGATTGTLTINNPTVVGSQTTQNLYNTTATTLNFAGAATTLNIGATSGTTNIKNNLDVDLTLNARDINNTVIGNVTPAAATFTNVTDQSLTATRVTFAGVGGDLVDSANFTFDANILTVKNFSINGDTAEISVIGGSGNVILNPDTGGVIDATNSLISNVANPVSAQDVVTLSYLNTELSTNVSVISESNTDITITDTGTGVITANVDGVSTFEFATSSASFFSDFVTFDAVTSNVAIDGTAYVSGIANIAGDLNVDSITTLNDLVSITDTTASTGYTNGALTVDGGVGVAGNISVKLGQQITVGIEDPSANVSFPERQMILIANANVSSGINVRNLSSAEGATSNFIAIADNNVGENHAIVMGIASSNFNDGTAVKANDAYMFTTSDGVTGGNLHLSAYSADKGIYLTVGGPGSENQVAKVSNSNVTVLKDTISTSSATGALVVEGGVGLGANLNVSGGTVINIDQTAEAFQVKGQFATTLIYADSVTDTVTIGGSNTTPISGATLRVNGTGALVLPVGTTSQRPGSSGNVDVAGMMRINSSLNILEYYDGTAWQSSQGSFTVINSEAFSGNGVANVFTMLGDATTSSTIVSINGIVQIPTTSYSISGNVLTFTEAPETGDTIDVRRLTTTVTVDELGFNQNIFKANASYAYIATGSVTSVERLLIDNTGLVTITGDLVVDGNITVKGDTNGQINIGDSNTDNVAITADINSNLVPSTNNTYDLGSAAQRWRNVYSHATIHDETATNVSANATPTIIDQFLTSEYSSAKYLVQIKDGGIVQAAELLLVQDTANAYITTYGVLSSNVELGSFTANITSGNVNLYYTSTTATNSNVKVHTTYIV